MAPDRRDGPWLTNRRTIGAGAAGRSAIGCGETGHVPGLDQGRARGRDNGLADRDLVPPARASIVPDPIGRDRRGPLARGRSDRGATGRRHQDSDARRGSGRLGRRTARGRTGRERIARGRIGHPATIARGRTGRPEATGHAMTARGEIVRPVRVRPVRARLLTGDRVATPDAAPFAPSGRPRCRHPRSSDRTRS
jgi:hypothetical protein